MPTYQYSCTSCARQIEAVQSFTDAPITECPHCAGTLRKVFSAVGVVFKGSGFYRTDSRGGASKSNDSTTADGSAKKDTKPVDESSSKPATTTTSTTQT